MRILMLALIDTGYPQLLRKTDSKFRALRAHMPDTLCRVVGNCRDDMRDYSFTYLTVMEHKDRLAACANLAETLRPDVIYFRSPWADCSAVHFARRFPNTVFEYNSIPEAELPPEAARQEVEYAPQMLSYAAGIVGVTGEIAAHQVKRLAKDIPWKVISNGIDPADKAILPRPELRDELHIVLAAHHAGWHGADRVLRGMANSRERVVFHLAGDGPALGDCRDLARQLGLTGRVVFHGRLDTAKLYALYARCHLAVGALSVSRNTMREVCSLKHREYALLGIPFIYAGNDADFSPDLPFVLAVPDDDRPVDTAAVHRFAKRCAATPGLAAQSHAYALEHLTFADKGKNLADFLRILPVKAPAPHTGPLISAVIPCFNQARFLPEAVASLAAQNFPDMEVIIVNDGSPDNTSEAARALAVQYPDLNIRLVEQENTGLSGARNAGIQAARGLWILPLDSDDMLAEGFLNAAVKALTEHPEHDMITGSVSHFGARESSWRAAVYLSARLPLENDIPYAGLFRRSLWETVGGYDASHPWGVEDWHFWLKCRQHGWNPLILPVPMLHYRVHESAGMFATMMERWDEALAMHHTMLPDCYPTAVVLAGHHRLLDMSPESEERIRCKREKFPELPLPHLWQGLAHMGRKEWREAQACLLKALHTAEPAFAWQAAYQLRLVYQHLGLPRKARTMQDLCVESKPELAALFAGQEALIESARSWADTPEDKKPRRILLMGEFFWPSLGGIEVFLDHLGVFLLERGFEVHVLTKTLPERTSREHNGMVIHEFPNYFNLAGGIPGGLDDFDFLLGKCGFSHVICLAHPDPWSMYLCNLPQPRPRIVMLPILSNFTDLIQREVLVPMLRYIERADHICRITESAGDAQLLELARMPNCFLPHMVPPPTSAFRFRDFLGIGPDMPLFLHVANFWPLKNHMELIKAMRVLQGDWRMALIGSPHDPACLAEVEKAVQSDSRFILLRRQSREVTTAAVLEADIVLLGSKGEGCPMIILEAMSAGTPWLATPDCGSVRDQAGGIVVAVRDFPLIILELMTDGVRRKVLGRLGKEHWEACFSKEAVLPAFLELIENEGRNMPDLSMPGRLRAAGRGIADEIRHDILARHGVSINLF